MAQTDPDFDAALADFEEAITRGIGEVTGIARFHRARLEHVLGNTTEALNQLGILLSVDPTYFRRILDDLGLSGLFGAAQRSEFEKEIRSAQGVASEAARKSILGRKLTQQGHLDEALEVYRLAEWLDPNSAVRHFDLGRALQAMGRDLAAVDEYNQAIELTPSFVAAHCQLGLTYEKEEVINPEFARSHWETCALLTHDRDIENRAQEALYRLGTRTNGP